MRDITTKWERDVFRITYISRLSCSPMPSLSVFACTTRVIFLQMHPQSKLNHQRPFSPSPPLKCVTSWPGSSFLCPPRRPWSSPGLGGADSTSIGLAITTPLKCLHRYHSYSTVSRGRARSELHQLPLFNESICHPICYHWQEGRQLLPRFFRKPLLP